MLFEDSYFEKTKRIVILILFFLYFISMVTLYVFNFFFNDKIEQHNQTFIVLPNKFYSPSLLNLLRQNNKISNFSQTGSVSILKVN
jgi:cell division protein YceG involved in septum cleavage